MSVKAIKTEANLNADNFRDLIDNEIQRIELPVTVDLTAEDLYAVILFLYALEKHHTEVIISHCSQALKEFTSRELHAAAPRAAAEQQEPDELDKMLNVSAATEQANASAASQTEAEAEPRKSPRLKEFASEALKDQLREYECRFERQRAENEALEKQYESRFVQQQAEIEGLKNQLREHELRQAQSCEADLSLDALPVTLAKQVNFQPEPTQESQHEFKALYKHGEVPNGARQISQGRCFRLLFDLLPPWVTIVPRTFSAGLPLTFGIEWEGNWEVVHVDRSRAFRDVWLSSSSSSASVSSLPTYGSDRTLSVAQISLRSPVGYIRFQRPAIVNRLVVTVPDSRENKAVDAGIICGFYRGAEQWCVTVSLHAWRVDGSPSRHRTEELSQAVDEIALPHRLRVARTTCASHCWNCRRMTLS